MLANTNILSLSRLDIKPMGARQIQYDGREKWSNPTWKVQKIDLVDFVGRLPGLHVISKIRMEAGVLHSIAVIAHASVQVLGKIN